MKILAGIVLLGAACAAAQGVATVGEAKKTALVSEPVYAESDAGAMLLGPAQIRHFYNMDAATNRGEGQTIAIIINSHDELLEHDLGVFSARFGLPLCEVKTGCFQQISGPEMVPVKRVLPAKESGHGEVSMDVEWAHAMAPKAKLIVVEAPRGIWEDFLAAVDAAVKNGATVVSLSLAEIQRDDRKEKNLADDAHFANDAAVYVSAAGDHAHGSRWPASSPTVVGVGGTTVVTDAKGTRLGETAWSSHPDGERYFGTGGGISNAEAEPPAQLAFGLPGNPGHMRGTPDVSAYAVGAAKVAVYTSYPAVKTGIPGWRGIAGTSAGTPMWAGLLAVANSMRVQAGKTPLSKYVGKDGGKGTLAALYTVAKQTPAAFFDITEGNNATGDAEACGAECSAAVGYDYLTGLGSPNGAVLLGALAALP